MLLRNWWQIIACCLQHFKIFDFNIDCETSHHLLNIKPGPNLVQQFYLCVFHLIKYPFRMVEITDPYHLLPIILKIKCGYLWNFEFRYSPRIFLLLVLSSLLFLFIVPVISSKKNAPIQLKPSKSGYLHAGHSIFRWSHLISYNIKKKLFNNQKSPTFFH